MRLGDHALVEAHSRKLLETQAHVVDGTDFPAEPQLADEREVEKTIREFYPGDSKLEIDRLVDICPDIARGLIAADI